MFQTRGKVSSEEGEMGRVRDAQHGEECHEESSKNKGPNVSRGCGGRNRYRYSSTGTGCNPGLDTIVLTRVAYRCTPDEFVSWFPLGLP